MQPDQIEYGWLTTGPTRNMLVARIEELLSTGTLRTRSKLLVRELRSMQFDAKGTPRAKEPDKDDVAIAFALAAQGRYENFSGRQTEDKAPRFTGPDAAFWERERTLRETQQSHDRLRSSYRPPWFVGLPGFSPDLGG